MAICGEWSSGDGGTRPPLSASLGSRGGLHQHHDVALQLWMTSGGSCARCGISVGLSGVGRRRGVCDCILVAPDWGYGALTPHHAYRAYAGMPRLHDDDAPHGPRPGALSPSAMQMRRTARSHLRGMIRTRAASFEYSAAPPQPTKGVQLSYWGSRDANPFRVSYVARPPLHHLGCGCVRLPASVCWKTSLSALDDPVRPRPIPPAHSPNRSVVPVARRR